MKYKDILIKEVTDEKPIGAGYKFCIPANEYNSYVYFYL